MKNRCIAFSLVGLIIPIIFLACKDDLFFPQEQSEGIPNTTLTIRKAREIFEQFVSSDSLVLKKSRVEKPGLCPGDFTPIWDKANESADSLIECVDVPICAQFSYRGTFVSKEPSKKGETERYATDIFQKLLVVYDKRSRLTGCFIINLIPAKQYYNKHKNDVALRFANCENDFCGIVLYSYLKDNSTVRINVLRDGKAVKAASVYNNENTFEENHRIMRSFVEDGVVYRMPKATAARGGEYIGFRYSSKWHAPSVKNEKGIALERINPDSDTQDEMNWTSASATAGYGTPGYRNSQYGKQDEGEVTGIESPVYSEATKEYTISYHLDESGYTCRAWIFDISGRHISEVVNHDLLGIEGELAWNGLAVNGSKVRTGVYIFYAELVHPQGQVKRYKEVFLVK